MKTLKALTIALVLILVSCSSVKDDTVNYRLKDDILYYKNDQIGHVKEYKSEEKDEEIKKKYTIVLHEDINKDVILKDEVIKYFLKKFADDNTEVEVYTTLVK